MPLCDVKDDKTQPPSLLVIDDFLYKNQWRVYDLISGEF